MHSVEFFSLAYRASVYAGVMKRRAQLETEKRQFEQQVSSGTWAQRSRVLDAGGEVAVVQEPKVSYLKSLLQD